MDARDATPGRTQHPKHPTLTTAPSKSTLAKPMATKQANGDPTERMIAVLERIEAEAKETNRRLGRVEAEAKETNRRLGHVEAEAKETNRRLGHVEARLEGLETQAKRTNKRLGTLEKRLTGVKVPGMSALEERVERLEAAVFKTAAE